MTRRFDVVTFDCYGTLIDWESGIREAFAAEARGMGVPVDARQALALYVEIEAEVEAEPYRPYRDVLAETARRIAGRLGWPLPAGRESFLPASLPSWRPFPDTNRGLMRLASAGYRLGILSNVDDELLAWSRRHFIARFDPVVTAEQVGSYKPAPGHFTEARARIGGARWLHAGQSYFHDMIPARALGIPAAWVNRHGDAAPDGHAPEHVFPTVAALADWLAP